MRNGTESDWRRCIMKELKETQFFGSFISDDVDLLYFQAFEVPDGQGLAKSWIVLGSLYAFFAVDRILKFAMEIKRVNFVL